MTLDLGLLVRASGALVLQLSPTGELLEDRLQAADVVAEVGGASVDSRTVERNGVFFALPGERVDGHDFLSAVMARGARVAFVRDVTDRAAVVAALSAAHAAGQQRAYVLMVPDPLRALHVVAREWRRIHRAEIIGITGSIGKTTTKEIVSAVLSGSFSVLKSEANLNTEIGLPLTLLRLRDTHRVAVLEMGMYIPGDIATLASIAEPRIGIVTNVHPIHLERAGSIERIARGKSELVAALPADGVAILNGDDVWTRAMAVTSAIARPVLVGASEDSDLRILDVAVHGLEGTSFSILAEGETRHFRTAVPGEHTVPAFAMAVAVARELGVPWDAIQRTVEGVILAGRQHLVHDDRGLLIIDDTYNAAPPSMEAALELLRAAPGEHIAVLGDMLELGPDERALHLWVGRRAAQIADWLVVRGPRGAWIADGAEAEGLPAGRVVRVASNQEAAQSVLQITGTAGRAQPRTMRRQEPIGSGDDTVRWSVLVKASRGMGMEEVVTAVLDGDR